MMAGRRVRASRPLDGPHGASGDRAQYYAATLPARRAGGLGLGVSSFWLRPVWRSS